VALGFGRQSLSSSALIRAGRVRLAAKIFDKPGMGGASGVVARR